MNNIEIAKQTLKITAQGRYCAFGREIMLPEADVEKVIVITPEEGQTLTGRGSRMYRRKDFCTVSVVNSDSFRAGRMFDDPLVMNFANAHNPGGGFKLGANAQEESLCRCSTLYASISSDAASVMYRYNNTHMSRVESDHMLISPEVVVFRDENYELLEEPVVMGVVTVPAPNRFGSAMMAGKKLIEETFVRRIRIMLLAAACYGYKDLVLGAWGCGAFGNDPHDVAGYFRKVIVDEEMGYCFDNICFAVYGREDGKNITAFREVFC